MTDSGKTTSLLEHRISCGCKKIMAEALVVAVVTPMKDKTREALLKGKVQYK